ncbi:LADA_0D08130g1_1 [Lachancea dasiensis]|uniref:LADA_0D08130g1_1 n=1 Tax=Lachancea dasiensis TaxID=1072105 RepID=A0A1G4J6S2_9SACH|nr:LADA_0D08130g1_1 [Lachancea dasiensis]
MSIPETSKAVVVEGEKIVVKDVPVQQLTGTQILVKVKAVAGNPTDWKHLDYKIAPQGSIIGNDLAGTVVKLGPDVDATRFAVGKTVIGGVHGGSVKFPQYGAFTEYAVLDSVLTFQVDLTESGATSIAEGPVKNFESGASLPVSLLTAGEVLHYHFKNKLEWEPKSPQHDFPILIWGGATAAGQWLIQLAKQMFCYSEIVVVASKKHEQLLKKYGADAVFDYHDEDVIEQMRGKYGGFKHLVDGVSVPETFRQVYQLAAPGATIIPLMNLGEKDIPEAERKTGITIDPTLLYLVFGHDVPFGPHTFPANPAYRSAAVDLVKFLEPRIKNGALNHIPIEVYPGGLEAIPRILSDIKNGANSGVKLVARV